MSYPQKIFGIGLPKTGTTTLGAGLSIMGLNVCPYQQSLLENYLSSDFSQIYEAVAGYDAFQDWPWSLCFKEMDEKYPESKFILTLRSSSEVWLKSMIKHRVGRRNKKGPELREKIFGYASPEDHSNAYKDFYERFTVDVQDYFRPRPRQLLTVCWESGDGWRELCQFLNLPVPPLRWTKYFRSLGFPVPPARFPHSNKGTPVAISKIKNTLRGTLGRT